METLGHGTPADAFTCCETPIPWPARTQDRTCPECGTVWEHDGADLGAGARIKPPAVQDEEPAAPAYRPDYFTPAEHYQEARRLLWVIDGELQSDAPRTTGELAVVALAHAITALAADVFKDGQP